MTDETHVRNLMGEISRAFIERDVDRLNGIFDDTFAFTDPYGAVLGKEEWLADVATGELTVETVQSDAFDIRQVADDAMRVRGQLTLRAHYSKSNYNGTFAYIGLYTKHGEEWRLSLSSARRVST
jgi:hypothetical protein